MSTSRSLLRRVISKKRRKDLIPNLLGFLGGTWFVSSRFNYARYFYRQNLVTLSYAAIFGVSVLGLMIWNRRRGQYWKEWRRIPGVAFFCAAFVLVPVVVCALQWESMYEPKVATKGIVAERGTFRIHRKYGHYDGLLIGIRSGDGRVNRFDLSRYQDAYQRTAIGQPISIQHFPWIRDEFLEIRIE